MPEPGDQLVSQAEDTVSRTCVFGWGTGKQATLGTPSSLPFFTLEQLQLNVGYSCLQQAKIPEGP